MRIIDDKGRFLGIVNLFDLIVVICLMVAAGLTVKWKGLAEDPSWVNVKQVYTRCVVKACAPSFLANLVCPGDEMLDDDGVVAGRIIKVISNEPASTVVYVSNDGEKLFFNTESRAITVEADILSYEKRGDVYASVSRTPIREGSTYLLGTKKYTIQFTVISIVRTVNEDAQ